MLAPEAPCIYAVMDGELGVWYTWERQSGYFKERPRGLRDRIFKEHPEPRARGSALRRHRGRRAWNLRSTGINPTIDTVDGIDEVHISRFLGDRVSYIRHLALAVGAVPRKRAGGS